MRWRRAADTLITCGAPQSNHCRITLAAAVKEGLKCRFVIEERVPEQLQEGSRRQQLHVRADGRRGDHRGAGRLRHGRGDVEDRAGSRLARPQGLHHPGRRLERDRRPGLRRLRAGDAAAVDRHGRGARRRRRRLGQLGHAWRHGRGLLRQQHQDPADRHRRQPRSGRPGAAGPQGGAGGRRPARHRQGAARGGEERRRLLAAEILRAEHQDGRGRPDAGAHRRRSCSTRSTPARSWPA